MRSMMIEILSIRMENGIVNEPECIQLNKWIFWGISGSEKKMSTERIKEAKTDNEAMIPADRPFIIDFPKLIRKNPASGKTSISQASWIIS